PGGASQPRFDEGSANEEHAEEEGEQDQGGRQLLTQPASPQQIPGDQAADVGQQDPGRPRHPSPSSQKRNRPIGSAQTTSATPVRRVSRAGTRARRSTFQYEGSFTTCAAKIPAKAVGGTRTPPPATTQS